MERHLAARPRTGASVIALSPPTTTPQRATWSPPPRTTRILPVHASRAILHRVVVEARSPGWSVLASARRIEVRAHGDARVLRAARARLRRSAPHDLKPWQARALVSLTVAINELESEQ